MASYNWLSLGSLVSRAANTAELTEKKNAADNVFRDSSKINISQQHARECTKCGAFRVFSSSVVARRVCLIFMYPRVFLRCCRRETRQFKAEIAGGDDDLFSVFQFAYHITSCFVLASRIRNMCRLGSQRGLSGPRFQCLKIRIYLNLRVLFSSPFPAPHPPKLVNLSFTIIIWDYTLQHLHFNGSLFVSPCLRRIGSVQFVACWAGVVLVC